MEEKKLKELLNDMTFEEKVGQLTQVVGSLYGEDSIVTGLLDMFQMSDEVLPLSGSVLSITGAERIIALQKNNMERQPHHIPQIFMSDIINGFETIYPVPLGLGATFNPQMVEGLAHMAATEGAAAGLHVTFSPMVDLVRDARWGRVMESTGEDPYLNSLMGAAMVKGYQGDDIKEKGNLAACVKHFAAYGAAEGGRDYDNVELSERTLREDYLPAYQACVDAGAKLVMTSFNTLNRIPSSGNKWLMRDVLREEMNFDGVLISDYGAIKEMINHRFSKDEKQACEQAINAGVDIEMMSCTYFRHLRESVADGTVSMELIDEAVWRILVLKNELGLFEHPYKDASAEDEKKIILCDKHRELAKEAAIESFVLLKNEESILPLKQNTNNSIAFVGPYAVSKEVHGSWSFPVNKNSLVSIEEGVLNQHWSNNCCFKEGCFLFEEKKKFKDGSTFTRDFEKQEMMMTEAIEAAKVADTVVVCIGEHFMQTGEASSRTELKVSETQMELLRKVHDVNSNVVSIIFSGRPLELTEISSLSKAVLYAWFPGTECGNAIAEVLSGKREPSGRLSMSFSYRTAQMPNYYSRFTTGRPNNGTLDQGFVNGYIDQEDLFLYPFGYGLGYTKYSYSPITFEKISGNNEIIGKATVTVKNLGEREGTETVQMYIQDLYGSVVRPRRLLKGFKKITLLSGESQEITFDIHYNDLKFYDIEMNFVVEPGEFAIYIGSDSQCDNKAVFTYPA